MDFLAKMLPPREWDVHLRNTHAEQIGRHIAKAGADIKRGIGEIANRTNADVERMLRTYERGENDRLNLLMDLFERNAEILLDIRSQIDFGFRSVIMHLEYQSRKLEEIVGWLQVSDRIKDAIIYTRDAVRYFIAEPALWEDAYDSLKKSLELEPKNPYILDLFGKVCVKRTDGKANPSEACTVFKEAEKYGRAEIPYSDELMISIGEWGAFADYLCEDIEGAVNYSKIAYEHDPKNRKHILDYARYLVLQGKENNYEKAWNIIWNYIEKLNDEQYDYMLLTFFADPELVKLLSKTELFIGQKKGQNSLLEKAESIIKNIKLYYDKCNKKYPDRLVEITDRLKSYRVDGEMMKVLISLRSIPKMIAELTGIENVEKDAIISELSDNLDILKSMIESRKQYGKVIFTDDDIEKAERLFNFKTEDLNRLSNWQDEIQEFMQSQKEKINKYMNMKSKLNDEDRIARNLESKIRELEYEKGKIEKHFAGPMKAIWISISIIIGEIIFYSIFTAKQPGDGGIGTSFLYIIIGLIVIIGIPASVIAAIVLFINVLKIFPKIIQRIEKTSDLHRLESDIKKHEALKRDIIRQYSIS